MCTALTFSGRFFGRNLDLEFSYHEAVVITPRGFMLPLRCMPPLQSRYAIIGAGIEEDGYPLYYDATNECGLSAAGLNFPYYAAYQPMQGHGCSIAPFELIPWLLGSCKNLTEAKQMLHETTIVNISFSQSHPLTPLHWLIADQTGSIALEPLESGLVMTDNPTGVLTNSPPLPYHLNHLSNYRGLCAGSPENTMAPSLPLLPYSEGMGAMGLPGDLSSGSRFVRAVFTKFQATVQDEEEKAIHQFFHILDAVSMTEGCVKTKRGLEKTVYSSCCCMDSGNYYYTTDTNRQICCVKLQNTALHSNGLKVFPFQTEPSIRYLQ